MKINTKDSSKKEHTVTNKIKKLIFTACKWFNDMLYKPNGNAGFFMSLCCLVMICMLGPLISPTEYFKGIWSIVLSEIFYAFFVVFFLLCTVIFHKKSACYWIANAFFIIRYVTLVDLGAVWNKQFCMYYLGLLTIYFCSWGSWLSAKDINKNGGKYDTICLALGLAFLALGVILKKGEYQYYKRLIVAGIALIYLYAISRAILRAFFSKYTTKVTLFQTMLYVAVYILLIIGVPFLLKYAGVKDDIVKNIITPIYAAAIGGILTLSGVAWTIKHADRQRKEDERKNLQPLFTCKYVDWNKIKLSENQVKRIIKNQFNNIEDNFVGSINIRTFCLENTSKTEFFLTGIYINDNFYEIKTKELVSKEEVTRFDELQLNINRDQVDKIKLCVEDLIENKYTMELVFSIENDIVTITGNKALQFVEVTNE